MEKNKKIGLVTCYWVKNYGSALQSYATQQLFDDMGIENETIDYRVSCEPKIRRIGIILRKLQYPSVRKAKISQLIKKRHEQHSEEYKVGVKDRSKAFCAFAESYIRKSPRVGSRAELGQVSQRYSAIVVGSDQLWLPENIEEDYYTLNWCAPGVKRISYSTSFGVASIPKSVRKKAKVFLQKLDSIAVREISGANIVKDLTGRTAEVVLDPTLMVGTERWDAVAGKDRLIEDKYIFCYFMAPGNNKRSFANKLKEETNFRIVTLKHVDEYIETDESFGDYSPYGIDPAKFINLIKYAEYVCTDSFHCLVFSTIYHREFFVFNRYQAGVSGSTNTRLESFLRLIGIQDRLIKDENEEREEIDYSRVDRKLERLRESSFKFLKGALKEIS